MEAPTREIDDELFRLTGDRGLPILNGVMLGYPSSIDITTEATREWTQSQCTWGIGRVTLYLRREPPCGGWVTSGLGSLVEWWVAVETLALEHSYRSWLPPVECNSVYDEVPRRSTRALSEKLGLLPVVDVEGAYADGSILSRSSVFYAINCAALTRLLEACCATGFEAHAIDLDLEVTPDDDLATREHAPGWRPLIDGSPPAKGVSFDKKGDDAIRQVSRFQGTAVEILEVRPTTARCFRAPMRPQGSPALNAFLREHGTMVAVPQLSIHASAAMLEALAPIANLGAFLIESPHGGRHWVGLWPLDAMPEGAPRVAPRGATTCRGAPDLTLVKWPLYRWGNKEMVVFAGAPEFMLYFCDSTGAIWDCEAPYDIFGFAAGNITSWIEGFVKHPGQDDEPPEGALLEIPSATPWELPEHLGVPIIEARSDARWKLFQSAMYIMWATLPPRGVPSVSFRARSVADAVAAVAWAKEHWGIDRVAVTCTSLDDPLTEPLVALGLKVLDGEQGGWHSEAFWEQER